jgi:hypothetical protein
MHAAPRLRPIWKITERLWQTTLAPIFTSRWRRLVSDQSSAVFGIARVRMKLQRLYVSAWSWRHTALAANVRQSIGSRVGQAQRVIQFAVSQQPGIGGDRGAAKSQQ